MGTSSGYNFSVEGGQSGPLGPRAHVRPSRKDRTLGRVHVGTRRKRAALPTLQNDGDLHSPNTNSIVWFRCSFSSGSSRCLLRAIGLSPARIATYCLPPTSNVIGGALKPVPTLIFQSCSMVVSS